MLVREARCGTSQERAYMGLHEPKAYIHQQKNGYYLHGLT